MPQPRPVRPVRSARPVAPARFPLIVARGEIVGIIVERAGDATPLLLDVGTRAMTEGTPALLLDLPFERMDHDARVVASTIARHAARLGGAVVVVAHRRASIAHLADRVLVVREVDAERGFVAPDTPTA